LIETMGQFANAIVDAVEQLADVVRGAGAQLASLGCQMQEAGHLPPDPTAKRHGDRWTTPVDGTKWRIAGRRGRPATYHWIEAGPTGWRR
jgi:hypothetical protein